MITAGLTGGICCGKSTVSKTFIKHNIPVIDADIVARKVVEPNTKGYWDIHNAFGADFFSNDGVLNRIKLGKLVFENTESMATLNKIMLPLIQEESAYQINVLRNIGHKLCIYDASIIIEQGSAFKYSPLIVVHCHRDLQLERLMTRGGLTKPEAMARIESQLQSTHKLMFADFSINTSGTIEESIKQTEIIIAYLNKLVSCEACQLSEELDVMIIKPEHTCQNNSSL
jgi:dephospho-CoA kinase